MRTSMAIRNSPCVAGSWQSARGAPRSGWPALADWTTRLTPRSFHRAFGAANLLLGDDSVDDQERADLGLVRLPGGYQQIMRRRLHRVRDVGPRRVCLRRCVRVVDDDGLLVTVLHLAPHPQLLHRVEPVERRRALSIGHRYEPLGPVTSGRPRDDAACLVRMIRPGIGDHLVDEGTRNG